MVDTLTLIRMINHDKTERNSDFWANMAHELWVNVEQLYDQIVTQWADRGDGEGMGGQMAAFCIYSCGFLASYFCKYPQRKLQVLMGFAHMLTAISSLLGPSCALQSHGDCGPHARDTRGEQGGLAPSIRMV